MLATEDELSEEIALRLADTAGISVIQRLRRGGKGYLKSRIRNFCEISRVTPVLVVADLDQEPCPARMIQKWLHRKHNNSNVFIRVAVREIESWVLADHIAVSDLLGLSDRTLPREPDALHDPKATLISLAARAARRVREDLLPGKGAIASKGLGYNRRLSEFVRTRWDPERASVRSPSLRRTLKRLVELGKLNA